jgi:hypothetical protein
MTVDISSFYSVFYQSISSHIEVRFRSLYHSRHKFNYLVYYDEDSPSTLKMKPSLATLKNILEPEFYRVKKKIPLLLKNGYKEFSQKFPSYCCSTASAPFPNPIQHSLYQKGPLLPPPAVDLMGNINSLSSSNHIISDDSLSKTPRPHDYNRNFSDYVSSIIYIDDV